MGNHFPLPNLEMFSGDNTLINGGTFTIVQNAQFTSRDPEEEAIKREMIKLLEEKIALSAFHNAAERYDPPKCHPGTRKAIIKEIKEWVESLDKEELFLWIYGPAGSGKSAIAQTIAEIFFKLGILAASFFFSRTVAGRNNDKLLIPTLAYQLTISIPEMRDHISTAIQKDPLIFNRTLKDQFDVLIVETLAQLPPHDTGKESKPRPRLIIIDGLDECSEPNTQRYILSTFSSALRHHRIQLSFLITSRPEYDIRTAFNEDSMNSLTRRLVLDDQYQPDVDIRLFLNSKFDEIKKNHPLKSYLPASWPSPSDINHLVEKSSGQFIYASTVIKFVDSSRHRPTDRLDIILGLHIVGENTPFAQLDALYTHIFKSIDLKPVIEVLMFLLTSRYDRKDTSFIEDFLFYQPGDLQIILADLHSLISIPPPGSGTANLHLYHASLGDFLMDKLRSGTLFIDLSKAHALMSHRSIAYFLKTPGNIGNYELFMEHFLNAYPTDELLLAFSDANLEEFFSSINDELNHQRLARSSTTTMTALFCRLLQNERFTADVDGRLHLAFQSQFDMYVQANLSHYTSDPDFYHVVTAFTLNCTSRSKWELFSILDEKGIVFDAFVYIDNKNLRFYDGIPAYRSVMVAFFVDSTRSGSYYIDSTRYIDLVVKCVEYLGRRHNDPDFEDFRPFASSVILEIISRFPHEDTLASLFCSKQMQELVGEEATAIEIEAYLKQHRTRAGQNWPGSPTIAKPAGGLRPGVQRAHIVGKTEDIWPESANSPRPNYFEIVQKKISRLRMLKLAKLRAKPSKVLPRFNPSS